MNCKHCGNSGLEFVNAKGFRWVPAWGKDEVNCKECGGVVRQVGPSSTSTEYKCQSCALRYVNSLRTYKCENEECGGFTEETSVTLIRPDGTQSESSVWSAA